MVYISVLMRKSILISKVVMGEICEIVCNKENDIVGISVIVSSLEENWSVRNRRFGFLVYL